jgi:hypothetical protein
MTDADVVRYRLQLHRLDGWEKHCINMNNVWGATTARQHKNALKEKMTHE